MQTTSFYFIKRLSDGLLYSGYSEAQRAEVWNTSGKKFPSNHSSVYLAKIRPELYQLTLVNSK